MLNAELSPEVKALETEAQGLLTSAKQYKISNPEQFQAVGEELKRIKGVKKQVDDLFDPIISKAHAAHKEAVASKKQLTDPLDQAESSLKRSMLIYNQEQARKEREEQERVRREAEEKRRKDEAALLVKAKKAEEKGDTIKAAALVDRAIEKAEEVPFVPMVSAPKQTVSGIATRKTWTWEVVDPSLVPREYLMIDEKKLTGQAKATGDSIKVPGVRFYQVDSLAVRL